MNKNEVKNIAMRNWFFRKWKITGSVLLIFIGIAGYFFGWFDYKFELSTLIGHFSPIREKNENLSNSAISQNNELKKSLYDLPDEFLGLSALQIEIKSQKYKDNFVEDKGYVVNTENNFLGFVLTLKSSTTTLSNLVFCNFDKNWKDQLLILKKNEIVEFSGVISRIADGLVVLEKCKLK